MKARLVRFGEIEVEGERFPSSRCASTIHIVGRAFHRGHGNRFVVCADERLIAFVEVSGNYNFA
jgi:hypothetical protein